MTVEYRTGDLFAQPDIEALAQGVNTRGVMGAGIAPLFKKRHPEMYAEYRDLCHAGGLKPGGAHFWQVDSTHWIYNLASQDSPGADARLDAVEESLVRAVEHAEEHFVDSIALPRIGSGIGGLVWDDVRAVIEKVAATTTVRLVVISLPGA